MLKTILQLSNFEELGLKGNQNVQTIEFCNFFHWFLLNLVVMYETTFWPYKRSHNCNAGEKRVKDMLTCLDHRHYRAKSPSDIARVLAVTSTSLDFKSDMLSFVDAQLKFLKDKQFYGRHDTITTVLTELVGYLLQEYFLGFVGYLEKFDSTPVIGGDFAILVLIFWYAAKQHRENPETMRMDDTIKLIGETFCSIFSNSPGKNWDLTLEVFLEGGHKIPHDKYARYGIKSLLDVVANTNTGQTPNVWIDVPYIVTEPSTEYTTTSVWIVHPEVLLDSLDETSSKWKFLRLILENGEFWAIPSQKPSMSKTFNLDDVLDFPPL